MDYITPVRLPDPLSPGTSQTPANAVRHYRLLISWSRVRSPPVTSGGSSAAEQFPKGKFRKSCRRDKELKKEITSGECRQDYR